MQNEYYHIENLALGYKRLQRAEEARGALKRGMKLQPVYHRESHRAHKRLAAKLVDFDVM